MPIAEISHFHHLPTLVKVISHAVWEGGVDFRDYDEGVFNSLAEHAFSLEVHSGLKSALNSLLCALCYCNNDFFSLLLLNCRHLLEAGTEDRAKLLHTLAHVAKSTDCSTILLQSDVMDGITSQLYDGFDQLLKAAKQANQESESEVSSDVLDVRMMLSTLCTSLAFLTDFVRNWTLGKDWMALEENRQFWPLMVELFSMDVACITKVVKGNSTSSVMAFELSFCQKVVLEYLSACLSNHTKSKRAFVRLVCNSVKGDYSFKMMPELELDPNSDSKSDSGDEPVLTPFLHNLLLELVLQPETIPVVVEQVDDVDADQSLKPINSVFSSFSLTPPHECLDFHPSYPVGSRCVYLELSPSSPILTLTSLYNTSTDNKQSPPKPKKEPASSVSLSSMKLPLNRKVKPPPPPPSTHSIEISHFELKKWLLPGSSFNPPQEDEEEEGSKKISPQSVVELFLPSPNAVDIVKEQSTFGALYDKSRELSGRNTGPALILCLRKCDLSQAVEDSEREAKQRTFVEAISYGESLLSLFVSERGLRSLAQCLPSLYRYQWPEKTIGLTLVQPAASGVSDAQVATKQLSLFVSQVLLHPPVVLPFHSILMLGFCLKVEAFDAALSENLAMVYVLLRLVLGTELEGESPLACSHSHSLPQFV